MGRILIGISSWTEPALVKSGYYPSAIKTAAQRLGYYSSKFSVAELDSSYHFFPTLRNMSLWLDNTPENFVFDVRAFSLFTGHPTAPISLPRSIREKYADVFPDKKSIYPHHLPDKAMNELWEVFAGILDVFRSRGKLGAVFFQFPPWFHLQNENMEYVKRLTQRLPGYRVAVEFRTHGWLNENNKESTLKILREQGITLVCVDEPQGFASSIPPLAEVTADLAIIRFHGRNKENWERKDAIPEERFNYLYTEDELLEWVPKIRQMAVQAKEVHVIFKNKHGDFPLKNAVEMNELLKLSS